VAFPVHELGMSINDENQICEIFDMMNEAMWEGLQTGNVVVHCLAGVHRAACVVVTHYLWR
jgi:protein-tyrosine phosphatase